MKRMILKCLLNCITNCKPSQSFDFQKTELFVRFMGLLLSLDGRMEPITCHLCYFVIKMEVLNIFAKNHIKHDQKQ